MKILFIIDPLSKLKLTWDSSIYLLREFARRGHDTWICDTPDIGYARGIYFAHAQAAKPSNLTKGSWDPHDANELDLKTSTSEDLNSFDAILIRKEPPFDDAYFYMTLLLEKVAHQTRVLNHPLGIRNTNEKLGILNFPKWIPRTLITTKAEDVLDFQKKLDTDVVLKPLDQKGGKGVTLIKNGSAITTSPDLKVLQRRPSLMMAQEFVKSKGIIGDKRILLFNGKIWGAYERHAPKDDFRANVGIGGTYHTTELSEIEIEIANDVLPYCREQKLFYVGIDIMQDKLIEINVTCPAGLCEMKVLYPERDLVGEWVAYLTAR